MIFVFVLILRLHVHCTMWTCQYHIVLKTYNYIATYMYRIILIICHKIDFYGYIKSICLLLIYSAHKLSALDTSYRSGNLPYMALSRFTITQILYIGQWQSTVRQMQLLTLILYNITNFYKYKYGTNTSQFMEIRKNTLKTSW